MLPLYLYLSLRPTNARIWHKAEAHTRTFGPVGISHFEAPQAPGNKPNPPEGGISLGGMAPWGRRNSPVPRHIRQNRPEIKRPTECNPTTGEEKRSVGTSKDVCYHCIYRCVPPTHEYGTRPFLRWARSQGRSPHASGKAKNTFGPVGIPCFGAPQAPGNNPPEGGISLGGWPPEAGGTLQCWGTSGRTVQR